MEKIVFEAEDGTSVDFFVVEQTKVNGMDYLLVADSEAEEAEALILKDISKQDEDVANYVIVDDDVELKALSKVFGEMLDDTELDY